MSALRDLAEAWADLPAEDRADVERRLEVEAGRAGDVDASPREWAYRTALDLLVAAARTGGLL